MKRSNTGKKLWVKILCAALAVCLLTSAASAASLLEKPENGYVADIAGVLESDTVDHIVSNNQKLTDATGAAIVVVTVDFLNGKDIADYATDLFNGWGIGDKDANNGLLILLAIGEDDYYVLQGSGLKSALPASTLQEYTWNYLESDFAAKDYDAGVHKLFDAFYQWFEDYYAGQMNGGGVNQPAGSPPASRPSSGGFFAGIGNFFATMGTMAILVLIIILVVVLVAADGLRYRRYRRRYYGMPGVVYHPFIFGRPRRRPRPPRPPRRPRPPRHRPSGGGFGGFGGFGGGMSRGGGAGRSSGFSRRSSGSFGGRSGFGGGRGGFGGGMSRGGGAGRRR